MTLKLLTQIHVVISVIAILFGLVILYGLLTSRRLNGWNALFLSTTVATSLTGFLFPFHGFTPAIGVGIISLILLAIAIFARYVGRLEGNSRWLYVITGSSALYLNVFVLIVQAFQKVPALKALAPTQTEAPFAVSQLVTLLSFILVTIIALRRFRLSQAIS